MKNTTKTIAAVLAVFLAAALFVGAASAAQPEDYRNVSVGDTAFVYEQIYVKDVNASTLVMLDSNGNPVNILTGSKISNDEYTYNLVESVVGSNYGRYYLDGNKTYGYIEQNWQTTQVPLLTERPLQRIPELPSPCRHPMSVRQVARQPRTLMMHLTISMLHWMYQVNL